METAATWVNGLGLAGVHVSPDLLSEAARNVGEESIVSRTGESSSEFKVSMSVSSRSFTRMSC